jgi:hypothetical protein
MQSPEVAKDSELLAQLAQMSNLRSLALLGWSCACSDTEAAACALQLGRLAQLRQLRLEGCEAWLSDAVLAQLVAQLVELEALQLRSCSAVSVDGVVRAVQANLRLARLEAAGPGALAGAGGRELRRRLHSIRPEVEVVAVLPHR